MTGALVRGADWAVLHDPRWVAAPGPECFDPDHWGARIAGRAGQGRGSVFFVRADDEEWALRHYQRGGFAGRLVADRYLWLGEDRTRSFREWRILDRMHRADLPVPRPVAAFWRRHGPLYSADMLTRRIPAAQPLSARLSAGDAVDWRAVGAVLRRFHEAGACHADLNAHNILLDDSGAAWLLDFDRGSIRSSGAWRGRNLMRLERSLHKIAAEPGAPTFDTSGWRALLDGYHDLATSGR